VPEDLQRYRTTEAQVTRAIDLAHAAGTERCDDFIRTEASAGTEDQNRWIIWSKTECGRGLILVGGDPTMGTGERRASGQAVLHVFRSDCQQINAHPSERNASWMSTLLS
jgi:hypothetical protein